MIDWLWLWLAGLQQKRAERRLAKLESFADTLIRDADAALARDIGIIAWPATPSDYARTQLLMQTQHAYAAHLGSLLGNIAGGPAGGALGRQIGESWMYQKPQQIGRTQ